MMCMMGVGVGSRGIGSGGDREGGGLYNGTVFDSTSDSYIMIHHEDFLLCTCALYFKL